ncbi:hypothetical protein H5410_018964 [Solanum commersonii]|uniref:Uncharacterized protein n=1 Tax=Solanum commersonii TaxID=4109 RepID=A0A9J6A4L4_SOLCO|nr:hypothetical protein H5410_018964 [Solanum commersonii]
MTSQQTILIESSEARADGQSFIRLRKLGVKCTYRDESNQSRISLNLVAQLVDYMNFPPCW